MLSYFKLFKWLEHFIQVTTYIYLLCLLFYKRSLKRVYDNNIIRNKI